MCCKGKVIKKVYLKIENILHDYGWIGFPRSIGFRTIQKVLFFYPKSSKSIWNEPMNPH